MVKRWQKQLIVSAVVLTATWFIRTAELCHAADGWADQRVAGPFVCRATFRLDDYVGLFDELARLQHELVRVLGIEPTREPIELYLFHDKSTYRRFLRRQFPNVPYRQALFVKNGGPGRVFAHLHREFEIDLRHECTHALLHASLPMVPLWLDEGLAEYFEMPEVERASGHAHLAALRWNMRLGMIPSLESLEAKRSLSEMGGQEYRSSWAWVHYMLHGPSEAHRELVGFLADIGAGTPPGKLSARLEQKIPGAQRQLVQHFKRWKR